MRSNRLVAFALMSSVPAVEGGAQELRAIALDRETKQPVGDVRVALLSRRRAELDTARTAADGSFTLRAKAPGKFFLQVRRSGYPAEETDAIFL
ncbi:MAG: carboxypeptidase-like regulatory domain-containing protein, partial [Gemmatimonadaceae bacterium]